MFYILLIVLLMNFSNTSEQQQRSSSYKLPRRKSFVALVFSNNSNTYVSNNNKKASCVWIKRLKHQNKICMKRKGLPEILWTAKNLAVRYCAEKFRYDQWNCSSKELFFKKVYRETAFMYSITSSALMHSVARACTEGKLPGCKCADHEKSQNATSWQWGGCGDNSKYAKRFTKKFLQLKKKGDSPNTILKYNIEVGIKVIMKNEEKVCRCHGVSENSPSFCPNTIGRQCENADNCATLCCGRGFYSSLVKIVERCNCRWRTQESYEVHCQQCSKNETVYTCK